MSGATTANGAKLRAKNKMTFPRAASGLIERNNESASATVIAASPAVINACVRAKLKNGGRGGNPVNDSRDFLLERSPRVFTP
jgi:hypothetical protein